MVKNPPANAGHIRDMGLIPVSGKIPWRRTCPREEGINPVFLPEESHRQRSLVGTVHRIVKSQTQLKRLSTHRWPKDHRIDQLSSILG